MNSKIILEALQTNHGDVCGSRVLFHRQNQPFILFSNRFLNIDKGAMFLLHG